MLLFLRVGGGGGGGGGRGSELRILHEGETSVRWNAPWHLLVVLRRGVNDGTFRCYYSVGREDLTSLAFNMQ